MKITICGDSHLSAVYQACESYPEIKKDHTLDFAPFGNSEVSHAPYYEINSEKVTLTAERYRTMVSEVSLAQDSFDVLAISLPFHTLRIVRHARLWKNYALASLNIEDRAALSNATFRAMVLDQQKHNISLVKELTKLGKKVIVIESPKIFEYHVLFESIPKDIALAADNLYRETMNAVFEKMNVDVLPCPAECVQEDEPLMKLEYKPRREGDMHHANSEWGKLVIRDLIQMAEASLAS